MVAGATTIVAGQRHMLGVVLRLGFEGVDLGWMNVQSVLHPVLGPPRLSFEGTRRTGGYGISDVE